MPPTVTVFADRLYHRLPEVYRTFDADQGWLLKRYLSAVTGAADDIGTLVERMRGSRAIGPADPQPWALAPDELAEYRANRVDRPSALGDPTQADTAWLYWLASLVGARLDAAASEAEQRDTIQYATSGYRAGTRRAMEDAARSALTGSRYARCVPHARPDGVTPGPWDVTIITRASETPDPDAVVGAILRKGVKPAGVRLFTATTEATWDTVEAVFPTWTDWDAATWDRLEESGVTYADVPDNLVANPSFETGISPWTNLNAGTSTQQAGGVDGAHYARVTSTTTATPAGLVSATVTSGILDDRDYQILCSVNPQATLSGAALRVTWQTSGGGALSTTSVAVAASAGSWQRVGGTVHAPVTAAKAIVTLDMGTVGSGNHVDLDAVLFRLITT